MSDLKRCDFCGGEMKIHSYAYEKVNLPIVFGGGLKKDNSWCGDTVGSHNSDDYDVCLRCFKKINRYLRKLKSDKLPQEGEEK